MLDLALPSATVGSGSYLPADVQFLLRPVDMAVTDVHEKERLIQTGAKHYSEMIAAEPLPSSTHLALFERAMAQNARRMAEDVQALALGLLEQHSQPSVVLVSFVRAGVPLGVLLRRALLGFGCDAHHYGVSIVRDRGIDTVALDSVIARHGAGNIVFVDGWTGKGAISDELRRCLATDRRFPQGAKLVVLADPCASAWMAASADDWVIPSGVLGATVSGLVSRSIWPTAGGLHGCLVCEHLRGLDVTRAFIERVERIRSEVQASPAQPWTTPQAAALRARAQAIIQRLSSRFEVTNPNRIKPGIAEATRAVLRRVPDRVLVRDRADADVQLLMHLTERAGIDVLEAGAELGPYRAATIIRGMCP